ncbi:MAG: hypothetical protein ABFD50_00740 [Smithella sp.]
MILGAFCTVIFYYLSLLTKSKIDKKLQTYIFHKRALRESPGNQQLQRLYFQNLSDLQDAILEEQKSFNEVFSFEGTVKNSKTASRYRSFLQKLEKVKYETGFDFISDSEALNESDKNESNEEKAAVLNVVPPTGNSSALDELKKKFLSSAQNE